MPAPLLAPLLVLCCWTRASSLTVTAGPADPFSPPDDDAAEPAPAAPREPALAAAARSLEPQASWGSGVAAPPPQQWGSAVAAPPPQAEALESSLSAILGSALAQSPVELEEPTPAAPAAPLFGPGGASPELGEAVPPGALRYGLDPEAGDPAAGGPPAPADGLESPDLEGKDLGDAVSESGAGDPPSRGDAVDLSPWDKILAASDHKKSLDTPEKLGLALGAPSDEFMGQMRGVTASIKSKAVVPYDMQLGAHIMSALSEKKPPQSLPRQEDIDSQVLTRCPLCVLSGSLAVSAPKCGDKHGQWRVPGSGGASMRWTENALGGMTLKVDSAVEGNGAVLFADVREKFTWDKSNFLVTNCIGLPRYQIEESIVRMNKMSNVQSEAGVLRSGEAFYYQYIIRSMNGTKLATTQMLKPATGQVNISLFDNELADVSDVVATATRRGAWEQRQWAECTNEPRDWLITFPPYKGEQKNTLVTMQDIRVAAAATITLMAYRQEFIGDNGIPNTGKWHMYWSFGKSILLILAVVIVTFWCWTVSFEASMLNQKIQDLFKRLESSILPRYSPGKRLPVLHPTWD